jgi:hypothetical protein
VFNGKWRCGIMKDYREFTENERESIDDICIEIHKRRLMRNGICVSMHRYDNVGLWFKFDYDPYRAYPKTLEKAIESFVKEIPVELFNVNYDDSYPEYSDQDVFGLIEEIQEYETDPVLHSVKQIFYYLYIGDLETIKTTLDDIDYSYQRGIDYDVELETLKEVVREYTSGV